jgi:hypothetical protein
MRIDRALNQKDKNDLLAVKDIVEHAYKRGIYEFHRGKKIPHTFTPMQKIEVHRRTMALKAGKQSIVDKYTDKLLEQHIILADTYEDNVWIETKGFLTTVADNPYREGTLYYKEWERGFNTGFARNVSKKPKVNVRQFVEKLAA